ncbi:hypothetical protein SRHO_G00175220 [Serrasalmus rhombeus]
MRFNFSHQHHSVEDNRANHTSNIYRSHCYRDIIRNDRFNIYNYSYRSIINTCKCTIWDYRNIYRGSINICRFNFSHQHHSVEDNRANHTSNIYRSHCYRDIIRNDRFNTYNYSYRSIINTCKCTIWDYRNIYRGSINICSFNNKCYSANVCGSSNHLSNNASWNN